MDRIRRDLQKTSEPARDGVCLQLENARTPLKLSGVAQQSIHLGHLCALMKHSVQSGYPETLEFDTRWTGQRVEATAPLVTGPIGAEAADSWCAQEVIWLVTPEAYHDS